MNFVVFGYNFPHWKTQNGLLNLCANGFKPSVVVLQDRKDLTVPHSNYRITPEGEYLQDSKDICTALGINYVLQDHNDYQNPNRHPFGVILGARILSASVINRFDKGILNIHPGILPGNRGLDNLKWSLIKGLPVGVTAHMIDHRIDMGHIVMTAILKELGENIRETYLLQRNLEQKILIHTMNQFRETGIRLEEYERVTPSEKFGVVPDQLDKRIRGRHGEYEVCTYTVRPEDKGLIENLIRNP